MCRDKGVCLSSVVMASLRGISDVNHKYKKRLSDKTIKINIR